MSVALIGHNSHHVSDSDNDPKQPLLAENFKALSWHRSELTGRLGGSNTPQATGTEIALGTGSFAGDDSVTLPVVLFGGVEPISCPHQTIVLRS